MYIISKDPCYISYTKRKLGVISENPYDTNYHRNQMRLIIKKTIVVIFMVLEKLVMKCTTPPNEINFHVPVIKLNTDEN